MDSKRLRRWMGAATIAAALTVPAGPALAQDDPCVDEATGSAVGQQGEECDTEVLDEVLVRPQERPPLPVTGAESLWLAAAAAGTITVGGGAVVVGRKRRQQD